MKKLLIASLFTVALALNSFGQQPPPPPPPGAGAPPAGNQPALQPTPPGPAGATNPAAANPAPGTNVPPGGAIAPPPGSAPATGLPPAPGMSPAPGAPGTTTTTATGASPAASVSPGASPSATPPPPPQTWKNFLIDKFHQGGAIMWPILIVSIIAVAVVLERAFWWLGRWMRRDPKRIEKVFTAIENGDVAEASRLSRGTRDPVLRMMFNGLNHQHASLQGALQVAAGIEIKRAGRFLVVMDTLVTLAPLLGLLGTITGLMRSFGSLGNEELAVGAVTGGIAEALIATACGLGIAIFALIPFNFFTSRVSNLEFELQTAATNLEVMLEAQNKAAGGHHGDVEIPTSTPSSATRSSI
ncbi:MAG: MotA/TolQ/ExbB proton channel family protein [Chthoniobacterales bacterium]